MVYPGQKHGVHGPANFVLTHELDLRSGEDHRFEVVGGNESATGTGHTASAVKEISPPRPPKRSLKIEMGGRKALLADRDLARMCYQSFVLNGVQYCRPHLLIYCHLCEENNGCVREDCDAERRELGLRPGGDPRLNARAENWEAEISEAQLQGRLKGDLLRMRSGGRPSPSDWSEMTNELKTKEIALKKRLLADVETTFDEGASQCCYWACAEPDEVKLFKCSGCGIAKYCSKEHQALDWKWEHKVECTQSVPQFFLDEIKSDRARHLYGDYDDVD
mmetsp:Transcript_5550/g.10570  ORF Transcript_5550/g.10570 Transcript_5550/m.10570 type:complete len:277 (+) Transcript_5550:2-832(+)